jgi:hypothetical protein
VETESGNSCESAYANLAPFITNVDKASLLICKLKLSTKVDEVALNGPLGFQLFEIKTVAKKFVAGYAVASSSIVAVPVACW